MNKLSVIITAKNNVLTLGECVKRVLRAPPKDKEVIIVYGKSKDGTERVACSFGGSAKILEDNISTGSAINTGVLNSSGDIVCYIEAHSFVSEDYFLKILETFKANPNAGYVILYRHIPDDFKPQTKVQKLMNMWRKYQASSTMGQFRAFRRKTFFDIGGFWIYPKGADDLEFATRLSNTKWQKIKMHARCWDYPRGDIVSILKKEIMNGASRSCWFNLYWNHPYAIGVYSLDRKHRILDKVLPKSVMLKILVKRIIERLLLPPLYSFKNAIKSRCLSFFPFYTLCRWVNVYGFMLGKRDWGKEKWDERVMNHRFD
jgi:glycosyltransferase involved in cell wall biosynthesis